MHLTNRHVCLEYVSSITSAYANDVNTVIFQGNSKACGCANTATTTTACPTASASSTDLVAHGTLGKEGRAGQLTVFHSAAAEYLQNREYQGLVRAVDANPEMEIRKGQYGVAADYAVHEPSEHK